MKYKKKFTVRIAVAAVALAVISASGCSREKNKYGEVKLFFDELVRHQENQIKALEKAENGREAADVFMKNREILTGLIKKGKEFEARYPELQDMNNLPAELKAVSEKLDEISKKYLHITMKIMEKFRNDPFIKDALK